MSRITDVSVAFLVGAAVGGITALLLAPAKGEVTRRRLREGGSRALQHGKDTAIAAATTMEEAVREKAHSVNAAARQQVSAVSGAVSEAKDAYLRELKKG